MSANNLSVFEKHQLKIAKATLKMSDVGAKIMGGMTKEEAKEIINKLKPIISDNRKKSGDDRKY